MPKKKMKILVAMSGGVDSSVVAALLVEQGYDVTGMFAVNYNSDAEKSCWRGDYQDALRVAAKLGIPLLRWDFTKDYKRDVLDYLYREYAAGRTPNPDVLCNKFIKFGAWLKKARALGFDYLATGHYARLRREIRSTKPEIRNKSKNWPRASNCQNFQNTKLLPTRYSLLTSRDTNKDQTYFLHQLTQEQLRHVLFPVGDYTKPEVRKLAKKFGLPTAEKEESMGICFIGEVPMKEFLKKKIKPKPGNLILSGGEVVGKHEGLAFYTMGERIGIKFSIFNFQFSIKSKNQISKPLYVVAKRPETNELVVGYEDDPLLYKKEAEVKEAHWIGQTPKFPLKCEVRLRHRQPLQKCVVSVIPPSQGGGRGVLVQFKSRQRAVTPGQFAVFYKKGECLGGGVIK